MNITDQAWILFFRDKEIDLKFGTSRPCEFLTWIKIKTKKFYPLFHGEEFFQTKIGPIIEFYSVNPDLYFQISNFKIQFCFGF